MNRPDVDTAPLGVVSDAFPLLGRANAIKVSRGGRYGYGNYGGYYQRAGGQGAGGGEPSAESRAEA